MIDGLSMIAWVAIAQGFFLSILYITSQKHKSASNRILALFLLSLLVEAVSMFHEVDNIAGYDIGAYFNFPETLMFFPGLFFHYILLKIGRVKSYIRFIWVIYGLGFLIWGLTLANLFLFFLNGNTLHSYISKDPMELIYLAQENLAFLLTVVVLFLAVRELKQYTHKVKDEYSDFTLLNIRWLWQFTLTMIPVTILWGSEILRVDLGGQGTSDIATATWGILFIFIYYVSYKAFVQKDLFEVQADSTADVSIKAEPVQEEEFDEVVSIAEQSMLADRIYLRSDLTIHDLAKETQVPARKISQGINRKYDTNFSEWVNRYRVEEAKKRLASFSESNLTIEAIGQEAGFKSRSAMYMAFKKITGKTPGDFKG
jgi:AraC-like DNA-binding protein